MKNLFDLILHISRQMQTVPAPLLDHAFQIALSLRFQAIFALLLHSHKVVKYILPHAIEIKKCVAVHEKYSLTSSFQGSKVKRDLPELNIKI